MQGESILVMCPAIKVLEEVSDLCRKLFVFWSDNVCFFLQRTSTICVSKPDAKVDFRLKVFLHNGVTEQEAMGDPFVKDHFQ